jgi:hypothetical protein
MNFSYPRLTTLDFLKVCLPATAAFYRYWDSKRQGREMPARSDLDPIEMRTWLPGIILVDVLSYPDQMIYRLVGTHSVDIRGSEVTGLRVQDGNHGSKLPHVMENYRLVIEEKKLVYDWDGTSIRGDYDIATEVLLLPLSSNGRAVDRVISYIADRPGSLEKHRQP